MLLRIATLILATLLFSSVGSGQAQTPPVPTSEWQTRTVPINTETPPNNSNGEYTVPFTFDPVTQPQIMIRAALNGGPPHDFIIDTGASTSLTLDAWAAAECKANPNGKPIELGFPRKMRVHPVVVRNVVIPGQNRAMRAETAYATFANFTSIRRMYDGHKVAGIFGAGFLQQFTLRIDFTNRLLTFSQKPNAPLRPPNASVLPLEEPNKDARYFVHLSALQSNSPRLLLDTGAVASSAPRDWVERCRPLRYQSGGNITVDGSLHISEDVLLPQIRLGAFALGQIALNETAETDKDTMGMDLLSRFQVTLDFRNHEMILERGATDPDRVPQEGWTGLSVTEEEALSDRPFRVHKVADDSPAQKVGVRIGDTVLLVNGQSVVDFSSYIVDRMVDGLIGKPLLLTLKRGDGLPFDVTVVPRSPFDRSAHALNGLRIYKRVGQPFRVLGVRPDTPAAKAGLTANDEIIAVDGKTAAALTLDNVRGIMQANIIKLLVRRRRQARPLTLVVKSEPK